MLQSVLIAVLCIYVVCQVKVGYDFVRRSKSEADKLNPLGAYVALVDDRERTRRHD